MTINLKIAGAGFSLVLAIIGTLAAIVGSGYGVLDEEGGPAAGFLPVMFGVALAVLSIADAWMRLRQRPAIDDAEVLAELDGEASDVDIFGRTQAQRTRILVLVIVGLIAAVLLTSVVGFVLAFALLMLGIAIGLEKRPIVSSVIITVVATAAIWAVFKLLLHVPLPTGLLGMI